MNVMARVFARPKLRDDPISHKLRKIRRSQRIKAHIWLACMCVGPISVSIATLYPEFSQWMLLSTLVAVAIAFIVSVTISK